MSKDKISADLFSALPNRRVVHVPAEQNKSWFSELTSGKWWSHKDRNSYLEGLAVLAILIGFFSWLYLKLPPA